MVRNKLILKKFDCLNTFLCTSVVDPDLNWIRIQWDPLIRIRIRIPNTDHFL